jgi:hypothetical protein
VGDTIAFTMNIDCEPTAKDEELDTMRSEYDFSQAVRGVTEQRYAEGTNVVVIAPDVLDVFPDSDSVNETMCVLAPVVRHRNKGAR